MKRTLIMILILSLCLAVAQTVVAVADPIRVAVVQPLTLALTMFRIRLLPTMGYISKKLSVTG